MKNISLRFLFLVMVSFAPFVNHAQQQTSSFIDNLRFGGNINLGFGDDFFTAGIAPRALYDFNPYFSVGLGPSFSYTTSDNIDALAIGTSELVLFRPYQNIQLSVEFEQYYVDLKEDFEGATFERDYFYPAIFLGFGYTAGPITAGIRYDVLYDEDDSIYSSALVPFVAVYF